MTLIGKLDWHLCDVAREVITVLAPELGFRREEKDVTQDPKLWREYAEQIPVTLIDGRRHDFWCVDPARLGRALAA